MLGSFVWPRKRSAAEDQRYLALPLLADQGEEAPYHPDFEQEKEKQTAPLPLLSKGFHDKRKMATPGGGARREEAHNNVERRRLQQLQQLTAGNQMTPTQLRRLYRLIDVDNDSKLQTKELQQGLLAMGFSDAASPEVLGKLLQEIDTDRSGFISEDEFITFFQRFQLDKLQKKVASMGAKGRASMMGGVAPSSPPPPDVTIDATVFSLKGVEGSTKLCVRKKVTPDRLSSFLQNHVLSVGAKEQDHHCWLDIVGFSSDILAILSVLVGVEKATLEDVYVLQSQKVEFVPAQETAISASSAPANPAGGDGISSLAEGLSGQPGDDDGPRLLFSPSSRSLKGSSSSSSTDPAGGAATISESKEVTEMAQRVEDDSDDEEDEEEAAHPHDSVRLHMLLHALALVNNGLVDGSLSRRTVRNISGMLKCRCIGCGTATGGYSCCPNAGGGGDDNSHYGRIDRAVRERVLRNARTLARSFYSAPHVHHHPSGHGHGGGDVAGAAVVGLSGAASPPPGVLAPYPSNSAEESLRSKSSATVAPAPPTNDHTAMNIPQGHEHHHNHNPKGSNAHHSSSLRSMSSLIVGGKEDDDHGSVALSDDSEARRRGAKVCGCIPASLCGGDSASSDEASEGGGPLTLASREHLNRLPPDLHIEQVSIIVVNDRLVITLRPQESISKDLAGPAAGSSPRGGAGGAGGHLGDSVISILFEGLKQRIRYCGDDGMHLYTSTIKALALDQADAIMQFSSGVRDELRDWHGKLEHEILTSAQQLHAVHLFSLQKMTGVFLRQMEPLKASMIQASNSKAGGGMGAAALMGGHDFPDNRSVSSGRASVNNNRDKDKDAKGVAAAAGLRRESRSFRLKSSPYTLDVGKKDDGSVAGGPRRRRGSNGVGSVLSVAQQAQQQHQLAQVAAQTVTLQDFFSEESALITELGDDLGHQISDIAGMKETCTALQTMRASLQSDGQNRILFVLTGFTVLATPLTVLSGLFGMNFAPSDGFPLEAGVNAFWIPAGISILLVLLVMWRIRFFSLIAD